MKRLRMMLIMALTAVLLLSCAGALAEEAHFPFPTPEPRDVSTFTTDETGGLSEGRSDPQTRTAGIETDGYLIVDPDDSVTDLFFYITDEALTPIPGAQIYISYEELKELYGSSGPDGYREVYLLREVEYGYEVTKEGYEPASAEFICHEETRIIHVILRKKHKLTVIVKEEDGSEVPGIPVTIDGKPFETDENGEVEDHLPDGTYEVEIKTPDGRVIKRTVEVKGDTTVVIEIPKPTLTVIVREDKRPMKGVTIEIKGKTYVTDENGQVQVKLYNGTYQVIAITPDGRREVRSVKVKGDTTLIIDLYTKKPTEASAENEQSRSDWFLVFTKHYNPEDYILTAYQFSESDLTRREGESPSEFQARVERYLTRHPNTIYVQAEPDRIQHEGEADENILKPDGKPLYTQRSLMPMGGLLRQFEGANFTQLAYDDEQMGVILQLRSLHNEETSKVFALMQTLLKGKPVESIVKKEVLERENGLKLAGLDEVDPKAIDVKQMDLSAIQLSVFDFDWTEETPEYAIKLPSSLYEQMQLEARVTPITPEAMRDMISDGLADNAEEDWEEITLASREYFLAELTRRAADGRLTDTESAELYHVFIDGRLDAREIADLRVKDAAGELSDEEKQLLLDAAAWKRLYRAKVFVICGNISVNVTPLVEMDVYWDVDEKFIEEYNEEVELNKTRVHPLTEAEIVALIEERLPAETELMRVRENRSVYEADYEMGESAEFLDVVLKDLVPDPEDEFYGVLKAKRFRYWTADVRLEEEKLDSGKDVSVFHIYFTPYVTKFPERLAYRLETPESSVSALYALKWRQQAAQEALNPAAANVWVQAAGK